MDEYENVLFQIKYKYQGRWMAICMVFHMLFTFMQFYF